MSRTYTPITTIVLPHTNARTAFALAKEVLGAAEANKGQQEAQGKDFPQFLEPALERLLLATDNLGLALEPLLEEVNMSTREADSRLDNAWGSLHDFLSAWLRMDKSLCPDPVGTQAVFDLVFGDGREWLKLNYKSEWVESENRLSALKKSPYIDSIQELGGMRVVEGIEQAHSDYGIALGITVQPQEASAETIGSLYNALRDALRTFVAKAMAWGEPTVEGSEALARELLKPIESWEAPVSSNSTSSQASELEAETEPEAEPVEDSVVQGLVA